MADSLDVSSSHACFGGMVRFYRHHSRETATAMRFAVYEPPQLRDGAVATLYYLAGLTCNEETFMIKAGAQRFAAEHGLMLIAPDTSPRGAGIAGEDDDWDLGTGAGFYLNAQTDRWRQNYRMEAYIADELPALIEAHYRVDPSRRGIFGHSMGGHGALTLAFKYPDRYRSVSAFAPISAPTHCPWGEKAFTVYLGEDRNGWRDHDATELVARRSDDRLLLIDQGLNDTFLVEQLHPHLFEQACHSAGQKLTLRRHEGYDHGYYFIASFMADHLRHHATQLG